MDDAHCASDGASAREQHSWRWQIGDGRFPASRGGRLSTEVVKEHDKRVDIRKIFFTDHWLQSVDILRSI